MLNGLLSRKPLSFKIYVFFSSFQQINRGYMFNASKKDFVTV